MPEPDLRRSSISRATSLEEMADFWDSHDLTDYIDQMPDVTDQFEVYIQSVQHLVALDPDVQNEAIACAQRKGVSGETPVNLAVKEAVDRSTDG